jgi:hypothetical protein
MKRREEEKPSLWSSKDEVQRQRLRLSFIVLVVNPYK